MKPFRTPPTCAWLWLALFFLVPACGPSRSATAGEATPTAFVTVASSLPAPKSLTATLPSGLQVAGAEAQLAAPQAKVTAALDSLTLPELDDEAILDPNHSTGPGSAMPPSTLPPEPARLGPGPGAVEHPLGLQVPADANAAAFALSAAEQAAWQAWLATVGEPRPNEAYGEFVVRIAHSQLGKPYGNPPNPRGAEALRLSFRSFQCVSFVESTLALARCLWHHERTLGCFARELTQVRYRGGHIDGYVSRLHYYEEWLADNANRGHLDMVTQRLGGTATPRQARYMTHHPDLYGPLADPKIFAAISSMELRVGALHPAVIGREQVAAILPLLQSGDVIAVTTYRADILVSHTGFAHRHANGALHMVHASSAKHHVVETDDTLADYINAKPTRAGVMVARPIAPHD